MPTDTIPAPVPAPAPAPVPTAGSLAAEIRAAIEAMNRRTGYLGPTVHQLERWAAEAERLEASRTATQAVDALKKERETHENTSKAMTDSLLTMEEREPRDEALLRQALEGIELHLRHHERGCVFLDEIALALRERLGEKE